MANMYPSKLAGGGGGLQETTLWTNSNPTASFTAKDVFLSDSISNYDYIKFTFRWSTSDSTQMSFILDSATAVSGSTKLLGWVNGSYRLRPIYGKTDAILRILTSYEITSTSTASDAYIIPVTIKGLK